MNKFQDSLRGYSFQVHKRDDFKCVYCGWDGKKWPNWLYLTSDHLLPVGHPKRKEEEFIVTTCSFCNVINNRTPFEVEGKTRQELIDQKRLLGKKKRREYKKFWQQQVRSGCCGVCL